MGRLKALPPRLTALPSRLKTMDVEHQNRDQMRRATQPWRAWYNTKEWRRLRWQALVRDLFICRKCGWSGGNTTHLLVGDHIKPHRGDRAMFFDLGNVQCLCKQCHDSTKQKEERGGRW